MNPQPSNPRDESAGAQPNGQVRPANTEPSATSPPPPTDWAPPIPLDEGPERPSFPVQVLPAWLRAWVLGLAEAKQTPPDLPALLGLGGCAAALARKFRVEIRPGWQEPTNLYVVVALPSGERKSAVFADALAPIEQFEREQQALMAPIIAAAASLRRTLEGRLKAAEAKAAKENDPAECQALRQEICALAKELTAHHVPASPRFVCDDETPENLCRLLALNEGRIFLAAPEATVLNLFKGRYAETANVDVFLKAYSGDPLRVGRISREHEHVLKPAVTMVLVGQPDVFYALAANQTLRQRGLLGRLAYSFPPSKVGGRTVAAPPLPADVAKAFHDNMLTLWRLPAAPSAEPGYVCHYLQFSPEADHVLRDLESWLEPQLAHGAELSHLGGWGQKLPGLVARLSAILHVAGKIGAAEDWHTPIASETVEAAVVIGRDYFLPHALAALGLMGADRGVIAATVLWESILRRHGGDSTNGGSAPSVTQRNLHQGNRRAFRSAEDMHAGIGVLMEYGYLRYQEGSGQPGRGHRSPVYWVNPLGLAGARDKGEPRPHWSHCTHSRAAARPSEINEYSEHTPPTVAEAANRREESVANPKAAAPTEVSPRADLPVPPAGNAPVDAVFVDMKEPSGRLEGEIEVAASPPPAAALPPTDGVEHQLLPLTGAPPTVRKTPPAPNKQSTVTPSVASVEGWVGRLWRKCWPGSKKAA